ncbi:unnamed protein product [Blepharisma stoltei]|uniref:PHD-type domain-containing protein n=1 Tax=Blepharisma stoltei TaxID=1481888 RepID=A0AAU9J5N3_9CILI|nr:unnamed protein product [Blepharisma stoltei]
MIARGMTDHLNSNYESIEGSQEKNNGRFTQNTALIPLSFIPMNSLNDFRCAVCHGPEAFLICQNCSNSYHPICASFYNPSLSYSTLYCSFCVSFFQTQYIEDSNNGLNSQNVSTKNNNGRLPEHAKTLEEIRNEELPSPEKLKFETEKIEDLLFICDSVFTFQEIFKMTPFSIEQLYESLRANEETNLIKELHLSIIKLLISHILEKENSNETLNIDTGFLYSISQLREVFDANKILPYSWLTLVNEVMRLPLFKDYSEDTIIENILQKSEEFPIENCYFDYSFEEKVGILIFLLNSVFDFREIHEELSKRIELKTDLIREKGLIMTQIRDIECQNCEIKDAGIRKSSEKIQKLHKQFESINQKIEKIHIRTSPIGTDSDLNEYYFFEFDASRIYVKPYKKQGESTDSLNNANPWYVYTNQSQIDSLIAALWIRGLKESKLIEGLKTVKTKLITSENETGAFYINECSIFEGRSLGLEDLKQIMLDLDKKFSSFLKKGQKQWDSNERLEDWRKEVTQSQTPQDLAILMLEHSQKSSNPLRLSVSTQNQEEEKHKYRKVSIRIWQDLGDYHSFWENLTQSITTLGQLTLDIEIYSTILNSYIEKKQESMAYETDTKIPKDEEKSKEPENLEKFEHEKVCFFCENGGRLIQCEACPKVVHFSCIGLKKAPKKEWYCDSCNNQINFSVQTRSKTRLRKLSN